MPHTQRLLQSAGVLVVLLMLDYALGQQDTDDASFEAGYRAAAHGEFVREMMAMSGVTSSSLCSALFEPVRSDPSVVPADFSDGCRRAVREAME